MFPQTILIGDIIVRYNSILFSYHDMTKIIIYCPALCVYAYAYVCLCVGSVAMHVFVYVCVSLSILLASLWLRQCRITFLSSVVNGCMVELGGHTRQQCRYIMHHAINYKCRRLLYLNRDA